MMMVTGDADITRSTGKETVVTTAVIMATVVIAGPEG